MKAMFFGVLVLSSMMFACAVDQGDEGTGEVSAEVDNSPPTSGQSCHVNATGVYNGTMNQNGYCCGTAVGDDGEEHYTCSACNYYACGSGPDLTKIVPVPVPLPWPPPHRP